MANFNKYSDLVIFRPFPFLFIFQAKSTIAFSSSSVLYPLLLISSATLILFLKWFCLIVLNLIPLSLGYIK